jgi:Holliday junction resolvase RusA-like endonuclease
MVLFTCKIPGRARSKKNSKQILRTKLGRPFIACSNEYKKWALFASTFVSRARKASKAIDCPVGLLINGYYSNKKHQQDADNLAASICDILQDCEVVKNDHLFHELIVKKHYKGETDYVLVEIYALNE